MDKKNSFAEPSTSENISREQVLRQEILERTKEIFDLRQKEQQFIAGKSRVHYAGRVYDEKEMQAMVDSVLDFWLTLGKRGNEFISEFAALAQMKYGVAVNSGSSANLVAIAALCSPNLENHLCPGDEVITTALTFPTTLNPILQYGLVPVFVDVEEGTYNIDANQLEACLSEKTRAIVFAHTLGNPAQMDVIMDFAKKHQLFVVEDTCDALDSYYQGVRCGTFGDISTYSFYAAHHITMGEGGALLTNQVQLYRQALSIRDWGRACFCQTGEENPNGACGRRFDNIYQGLPDGYDHKYVYNNIGYNLKPLDIQCAMGLAQLKKLPSFTTKRKYNFERLYTALKPWEQYFILPRALPGAEPSWFSFPITIRTTAPFRRRDMVTFLEKNQIETRMLFAGNIIRQPAYQQMTYRVCGALTQTDLVFENTFFIGVYPGLTDEMIQYMIEVIHKFCQTDWTGEII